ncbi:hypothetical protein BX616_008502, partial [Lobosporangium transversale]
MSAILRLAAVNTSRTITTRVSPTSLARSAGMHRHALQSSKSIKPQISPLSRQTLKTIPPAIHSIQQRRTYHDDGAYGYRVPKVFSMPDYSPEELANRVENANLLRLVIGYRTHGHLKADLDPLGIVKQQEVLALKADRYALTDENKVYSLNGILHVNKSKSNTDAKEEASLKTVLAHLEKSYCGKIAYEFTHIP